MKTVISPPRGLYSVYSVDERTGLWRPIYEKRPNQIQYDWAKVATQCIARGNSKYRISAVYAEFQNVASPGDPGIPPAYDRDEGVEYYTGLSGTYDYLRLPLLTEPSLSVESGYEDHFTGEGDDNNAVTFFAQTSGTVGVNGLPFGVASNSLVIGIALVAVPVPADRTRDVVFGRAYFDTAEQVPKTASHQVGVSWTQVFG